MDFYEMAINEMTVAKFGKGEPQVKNHNFLCVFKKFSYHRINF